MSTYSQLYVHAVWSTWERVPLIVPEREAVIYRAIHQQCSAVGAEPIAIGGVEDHVHVLVRFPPTVAVSQLIGRMKGASSRMVEQVSRHPFRWQAGYGAFTVGTRHVPAVRAYVLNQAEHHRTGTLVKTLEAAPRL
ncbi:MAG TPA: IS200/IS605 family transposase [Longimicrobiaceae bacterium]|nr:IS200/IS605 family transposase [Longimicrobiaceae bacterium]